MNDAMPVEIIRSARRKKTSSASLRDGVVVVRVPDDLDDAQVERVTASLVERIRRKVTTQSLPISSLHQRAVALADKFVDGVRPTSIMWSERADRQYGSCDGRGAIRLSSFAASFPAFVIDALLVHELAHLLHANHGPAFRKVVRRNPDHDRAEAWLAGYEHGRHLSSVARPSLRAE